MKKVAVNDKVLKIIPLIFCFLALLAGCTGNVAAGSNDAVVTKSAPAVSPTNLPETSSPAPAQTASTVQADLSGTSAISNELKAIDGSQGKDSEKVSSIAQLLFYSMERNYRTDGNFDFSPFFADGKTDQKYFNDKQVYLEAALVKGGLIRESYHIDCKIGKVDIKNSTAQITAVEDCVFEYSGGGNLLSKMSDTYSIGLIKSNDNKWHINTIKSSDEFDESNYGKGFDLDKMLKELGQ